MATKNFGAQIVFGAKQDASVKGTIGKLKAELTSVGAKMSALTKAQGDIVALRAARANFGKANEWLEGERLRLRSLKKEGTTKEQREAEKAIKAATKEWQKQRDTLAEISKGARAAGIDITKLTEEEKRLGAEMQALSGKSKSLQEAHARSVRLGSAFTDLKSKIGAVGSAFANDFGRMAKGLAAVGVAAGAAAFAVGHLVRSVVDNADNVADTADALGITTAALQTWEYAAGTVGVSNEKLQASFAKYSKTIEEGSPKTLKVLDELKLSQKALMQLPIGQQVIAVAEAMKRYKGSMSETAMVQTLFGKGAYKMTTIMKGGLEGLEPLYEQAKNSNYILTKDQLAITDKAASAFDILGITLQGLKNTIGVELAPAVTDLTNALTQLIGDNKDEIKQWAKELGAAIKDDLVPWVKGVSAELPALAFQVGETAKSVWKGITAVKEFVGGWTQLGAVIVGLNFAPTIAAFIGLAPAIWGCVTAVSAMLGPWGLLAAGIAAAATAVYLNWEPVKGWLKNLGNEWKAAFTGMGEWMREALAGPFKWIEEKLSWLTDKLRSAFSFMPNAPSTVTGTSSGTAGAWAGQGALMPKDSMPVAGSNVSKTQNNNVNINVSGAGNPADFALKLRDDFKRKPLFDSQSVLAPGY